MNSRTKHAGRKLPAQYLERIPGHNPPKSRTGRDLDKIRRVRRELARQNRKEADKVRQFAGRPADDPKTLVKKSSRLLNEMRKSMPRDVWVLRFLFSATRDATGLRGTLEALLLAYLLYWFDRGADSRIKARTYNGEHFYETTFAKLAAELGLKPRSVRTALNNLERAGLIAKRRNGRGMLIRPELDALCSRLHELRLCSESFRSVDELNDWASREQQDGTLVPTALLGITGGVTDAVILAQLLYYFGSDGKCFRARVEKGDLYWVAKTNADLAKLVHRPESCAIRSVKRLVDGELVERVGGMFNGKHCLLLRPDFDGITSAFYDLQGELLCLAE